MAHSEIERRSCTSILDHRFYCQNNILCWSAVNPNRFHNEVRPDLLSKVGGPDLQRIGCYVRGVNGGAGATFGSIGRLFQLWELVLHLRKLTAHDLPLLTCIEHVQEIGKGNHSRKY